MRVLVIDRLAAPVGCEVKLDALKAFTTDPRRQPAADVAAAGNRGNVIQFCEQASLSKRLYPSSAKVALRMPPPEMARPARQADRRAPHRSVPLERAARPCAMASRSSRTTSAAVKGPFGVAWQCVLALLGTGPHGVAADPDVSIGAYRALRCVACQGTSLDPATHVAVSA